MFLSYMCYCQISRYYFLRCCITCISKMLVTFIFDVFVCQIQPSIQNDGISLMIDCGLKFNSFLQFLSLPLVASKRLSILPNCILRDTQDASLLEGVSQISSLLIFVSCYQQLLSYPVKLKDSPLPWGEYMQLNAT